MNQPDPQVRDLRGALRLLRNPGWSGTFLTDPRRWKQPTSVPLVRRERQQSGSEQPEERANG